MKLPFVIATLSLALTARAARAEEPAARAEPTAGVQAEVRYPPSSVRLKLMVGGLAVSGVAYAAALLSSQIVSQADPDASKPSGSEAPTEVDGLKIPIAGPWIALGRISCASSDAGTESSSSSSSDSSCGAADYIRGVLYVLNGIGQLAGFGLVGEGIFMKTEAKSAPKNSLALGLPGGVTLQPVPILNARFTGLGWVGTF